MEIELSLDMLRVVEQAAIASAHTMGLGDRHDPTRPPWKPCAPPWTPLPWMAPSSSAKANATKRRCSSSARKLAPRFTIIFAHTPASISPSIRSKEQISAPPAQPNSIAVLAASEHGGLLHAPDLYMEKIIVGPTCKGAVDLDAPVADNLRHRKAPGSRYRRPGRRLCSIGRATRNSSRIFAPLARAFA